MHLCEILLAQEREQFIAQRLAMEGMGQTTSSSSTSPNATGGFSSKTAVGKKKGGQKTADKKSVVAASYMCDFGYIVLGHSKKKPIIIHNCFDDGIQIEVNKKLLAEYGFRIEPENAKSIGAHDTLNLTCEAFSTPPDETQEDPLVQAEGLVQLAWQLPVKQGSLYEIFLKAHFVLPDIVISSYDVNFSRVLVGQKKIITVCIKNKKAVSVEWSWKAPRGGSFGKGGQPWDTIFTIEPDQGLLAPEELMWIKISFTPNAATPFKQKLSLKIRDNPHRRVIQVAGQGDLLQMGVSETDIQLAPCLPYYERSLKKLYLENPTDYPITVYSADFDEAYRKEDEMLSVWKAFLRTRVPTKFLRSPSAPTLFPVRKDQEGDFMYGIMTTAGGAGGGGKLHQRDGGMGCCL